MDCERFEVRISDYLEGELNTTEEQLMQRHAQTCTACAELLGSIGRVCQAVHSLGGDEPDAAFRLRMVGDIQGELIRRRRYWTRVLAVSLAVTAALTILLWPDDPAGDWPEVRRAEWVAKRQAWHQVWAKHLPIPTSQGPHSHAVLHVASAAD